MCFIVCFIYPVEADMPRIKAKSGPGEMFNKKAAEKNVAQWESE